MAASPSLATSTVRGLFWTGSAFALQVLTTVAFYRFLPVAQMGDFEWALMMVMFLALLCDLGLGSALVQDRDAGEEHFDAAFWASLVAGAGLTAAVVTSAPWLSRVLAGNAREGFAPILSGLVLLVPFAAVSGVFRARLQRDLRWRVMALAEITASVLHACLAFALLAAGTGIMSAVYSAVAREVALLAGLAAAARWLPTPAFRGAALRRILGFGLNLTGSRCLNYVNSNLASIVIYPLLGSAANGYLRLASRLTLVPLVRVSTIITRVFFPTFTVIQDDEALLRRVYLRSVQALALGYWPVMAGLFVLADEVIALTGPEMVAAVWPLRLLALATMFKAVGMTVGSVFLARGRASWALYWSLFSLAVLAPALYGSVDWGVTGVCAVTAGSSVLFLVLSQDLANRLMNLGFGPFLDILGRPLLVSAAVGLMLWAVQPLLPAQPLAAGAAATAAAALFLAAALRLFAWKEVLAVYRSARGDGAPTATARP